MRTIKTSYITADKQIITETLADFRGNPVEEKTNDETKRTSAYYANGQLARQTDALNNTTTYEYKYLNKLTKTCTPFDSEKYSITENQYDKNGNVIKTIQNIDDNKNSVVQNRYNAMGLLEKVTLSDGTANGEKNITKYFYNNAGIQTKMYTGMSSENDDTYLTTEYEFDSWMRVVRTIDSTGHNSGAITYDLNGNVLTSTDANGNITTNTYDALNCVISSDTVNPDDSSKNVSKSYKYDEMGRITRTTVNGNSTNYLYDDLGRVYQEEGYNAFKGFKYVGISQYPSYETSRIFNKILYYQKDYEYDDEMRVINVRETGKDVVSYTYDANGNKKSETLGNGVVSTYTYNNANRITKLENKSGNVTISSYEYSYYLDGSDACKVRNENGIIETTSYEYDGLKRLTEESVKVGDNITDTYKYEYDDYSNRSKMTASGSEDYVTEYSYVDSNGKYTALLQKETKTVQDGNNSNIKQTVYIYDANGNQIKKVADGKTETNTYDGLNQLIGFTDGETTASYTYDVNGLRLSKTVNGSKTTHIWIGNQIAVDYTGSYTSTVYLRGTSLTAAFNWDEGYKGDYRFYTQNAHGDVVNLTDENGGIAKSYTYDAFGVEKNIDDSDTNPFRYCGEYFDTETGTIYLRARYYNPTIGRFISRDSYAGKNEDPLSLNLYNYCHNNPVYGIDPGGHFKLPNWAKVAIGAVAIGVGVAATVATGGAAAPALLGAAKIALASTVSSAVIEGGIGYITNGKEGLKKGLIDGAADGFMWGGIGAGVSQVASATSKMKAASAVTKTTKASNSHPTFTPETKFKPNKAVYGVDPKKLYSGNQISLVKSCVKSKEAILKSGKSIKAIDIFENGVIIDGNHTARAAANLDHLVDVYVHAGKGKTTGFITKLPYRK